MDDIIFSYTRAEAIADGMLVDVSEMAKKKGLRFPVALTCTTYADLIGGEEDERNKREQRLHYLLFLLFMNAKRSEAEATIFFEALNTNRRLVKLKAVCGPNDDGSPCITVMMPDED